MNKEIQLIKKEFSHKQELLENAKTILKSEFIGIDGTIDEILSNVSSWYFLSDIQDRPVIINLWGLTGVGKTSLIKRLVELIDFEHRYFRFDLGVKEGSYSFRESLSELCENKDDSPLIIALDEFQHSRTLEQVGLGLKEINNDENRMIWELIDSGKVQYIDWMRGIWNFEEYLFKLEKLLNAGVEVKEGLVTKGKNLYRKELDESYEKGKPLRFISEDYYSNILEYAGEEMNLSLLKDVEKLLMTFTGRGSLLYLNKILKIAKKPTERNFSKALIFVLGNLDEAYNMSGNFSADVDADDFHKQSLKITVPDIKQALKSRFRNEQIARLGNIHIIYPAFSKTTYLTIIKNELNKVCSSLESKLSLEISYDNSIIDLVYSEGVYPTQGARPIFTTIHQIFKSRMSFFLTELITQNIEANHLKFSSNKNRLVCTYLLSTKIVLENDCLITTTLHDLRKSKKDDMQAIVAVHESGHVILSSLLLKTLPQVVYSITANANTKGETFIEKAWEYTSRKEILQRVAVQLGGYVAEELIFGKENLTTGASGDIASMFEYLSTLYKNQGMGKSPILYGMPQSQDENNYHQYEEIEDEIKEVVLSAYELAKNTLQKENKLLLALSDKLSDTRMLKKNEIKCLIEKYGVSDFEFITDGSNLFYRSHLKKAVAQNTERLMGNYFEPISLNKK